MSCCDFDNDIYDNKIKKLENNLKNFEKEQNRTNAEIYTLLKQSGVDLSQYYALNEDDYTKTLTSEDDINTLEPGTYKIVKTDMPQNAPTGIASSEYDGTLIQSNSYALLFENGFDVCYRTKTSDETWTEWERVAFMSDLPNLSGYATQDWVNQQIQDITGGSVTADWVKSNFFPVTYELYKRISENSDLNDYKTPSIYRCITNTISQTILNNPTKQAFTLIVINSIATSFCFQFYITYSGHNIYFREYLRSWSNWTKIATSNDIPSLNGYATQAWVQSQNYLTEIPDEYATDTEVSQAIATALVGYATQAWVNEQISEITGGTVTTDIVAQMISDSLNGYATQTWVTGRKYQTAAQVSAAITAALTEYATEQYVNKNYLAIESTLYSDIPENADLNDYTTVGNYFCSTSVKAKTLKNTPKGLHNAFKLTYEEIAANDQAVQKIVENATGDEFIRVKVAKSWGEWKKVALMTDIPSLSGYASQEWVQQQGYQTVQQVNSLINTATADMLTQEDLDTFNYATENWVLQTALSGYAKTTIDDSLATRPSQEFDRFMIRSTDYHGVNAVSGAEGYLVMHMAVDPDSPTKFIRSSGIVANNKYVNTFSSDESSVGLATNNEGTVTVVGMSNNAKQMFILVKPDNME